jgi:hypothetical protein
MKAKAIIESLFEATPDEYLDKLGIVRRSSVPTPPEPEKPVSPSSHDDDKPDDETRMAVKGDILNDLPEELDFESMDGQELMDTWSDVCLGGRRIRNNDIEELISTLGYSDFEDFLRDNEGAVDAIVEFVLEYLEESKRYGDEGWWGMMVNAIKDAKYQD